MKFTEISQKDYLIVLSKRILIMLHLFWKQRKTFITCIKFSKIKQISNQLLILFTEKQIDQTFINCQKLKLLLQILRESVTYQKKNQTKYNLQKFIKCLNLKLINKKFILLDRIFRVEQIKMTLKCMFYQFKIQNWNLNKGRSYQKKTLMNSYLVSQRNWKL